MDAAIAEVVEFVEGPTVGGSRDWPLAAIVELFTDPRTVLPDLGLAPNALLKAAAVRGPAIVSASGYATVDEWLLVR